MAEPTTKGALLERVPAYRDVHSDEYCQRDAHGCSCPCHELEAIEAAARAEGAAAERERIRAALQDLPYATREEQRKIGKAVMSHKVRAILAESTDRGER